MFEIGCELFFIERLNIAYNRQWFIQAYYIEFARQFSLLSIATWISQVLPSFLQE